MSDPRPPWERGPSREHIDEDIGRALADSGATAHVCPTGERERRFVPKIGDFWPHAADMVAASLKAWGYRVEVVRALGAVIVSVPTPRSVADFTAGLP